MEPFLLRRVKSEVAFDLPKKTELVVYHGMSALQKKYYKAILMRDYGESLTLGNKGDICKTKQNKKINSSLSVLKISDAFVNEQGSKNRLLNILVNLRKCVDHPYLFDGETRRNASGVRL